ISFLYRVSLVFLYRPPPGRLLAAVPCGSACACASACTLTALPAGLAWGGFLRKALLQLLEELVVKPQLVGDPREVLGIEAVPVDAREGIAREPDAGDDHVLEGMAVDVFQLVGAGDHDHVGDLCAGA